MPEKKPEPLKLSDIIDLDRLQKVQDAFADAAHLTLRVVDPEGSPLTRASNLHGFCAQIHDHPDGMEKCMKIHTELMVRNRKTGGPVRMTCPLSGLVTAAVPIMLAGRHLGSWLISQVRMELPDSTAVARTAAELGLGAGQLKAAIASLPRTREDDLTAILAFLETVIAAVLEMGQAGRELKAKNSGLERLTGQFEVATRMMRRFIDSSDAYMYICDFDSGEILMANQPYCDMLGLTMEEMIGQKCWDVGGPGEGTFCPYCPRDQLVDENGEPLPPHHWENYNPNPGFECWLRCTNQAVRWVDGRLAHMVTFLDVTAEHNLREELAALAFFDRQSGLPNNLKLIQTLQEENSGPTNLLVCYDLRSLRGINEAYGRAAGDLTLAAVAEWVAAQDFGSDGLYRIGGDEYALYFPKGDLGRAQAAAAEIMERFAEAWTLTLQGQKLHVLCGVSVAVVTVPADEVGDELINRMERALEASRVSDEVVVYDRAMDVAYDTHVRLETTLRECVDNRLKGFSVVYQPIINPVSGTWQALEALCRWVDPDTGEAVPPLTFIKEAEQLGLIRKVGMFVLETAIKTVKKLELDRMPDFFLSVNLSPTQLLDEKFGTKVAALLKKHDYPGAALALEVTESTEFTFNSYSMTVIDSLRALGVRFSLDDFGTGYSSFNNLKKLPVSMLKTEREFILGIDDDSYMQYFFYTLAELAHAADMRLIAEGVETKEQMAILLRNGADLLQGFFFSEPLTQKELAQKLDAFTQVAPVFYEVRQSTVAQHIFSGSEAWLSSPRLLQLLNRSMQTILSQVDLERAIGEVLEMTGRHFKASRAYMFVRQPGGRYSNTHEWCAPGVEPQKCYLHNIDPAMVAEWLPLLEQDGMIVAADLARAGVAACRTLLGDEIQSVMLMPLLDEAEVTGFFGYECLDYREWLPEEVGLVQNLCMTTASCMKRERLQAEVWENDVRFSEVLNHIDFGIMVTDPDTDEVLWANEVQSEMFQVEGELVGRCCYEALYGFKERCDFCRVGALMNDPDADAQRYTSEYFNEHTGRWLMVNDGLVQWKHGRRAHLQYAVDITEVKQAQKKLEYYASTDALTGAYNRNSLIGTLRETLRRADAEGTVMSLVFVDINGLKYANDTFGHGFGDELIVAAVEAVRGCIRSSDVVGRYGGDEFIVLMDHCPAGQALRRIEMARGQMQARYAQQGHPGFGFSYGVVENTELPYEDSDRLLNAIINLADDRMRDHKKAQRAEAGEDCAAPDERLAGLVPEPGGLLE